MADVPETELVSTFSHTIPPIRFLTGRTHEQFGLRFNKLSLKQRVAVVKFLADLIQQSDSQDRQKAHDDMVNKFTDALCANHSEEAK